MTVTAETTNGKVRGLDRGGHVAFRGIPYALPPTGTRRFTPPTAPAAWSGVRDCFEFGPACPQPPSPLPGMAAGALGGEDCLQLNVYTPGCDDRRRPVLVWIHGGGFRTGSASQALYDGRHLVERGDVVLVTINYRLGALGYLHLDGACNLGQLDQICALEWVRDNAALFGGDPANVTIFGESAGGMATTTLVAMPAARGLFRRAISQSGAAQATLTLDEADRVRFALQRTLGLERLDAAELRRFSADELVAASVRANDDLASELFLPFAPVVDGSTLPRHPLESIGDGEARDVELVTGTTRDEWRLFTFAVRNHRALDEGQLRGRVASRLRRLGCDDPDEGAQTLLATYGAHQRPAWEVFDAIETDRLFRLPAIELAEAHATHQPDTFLYLFAWPSPAGRGALGACHAIELPFVFGTLDAPTMDRFAGRGPHASALCRQTMHAWLSFAQSGRPALEHTEWPRYDAVHRATLVLDRETRVETDPASTERRIWQQILP